MSEDEEIVNPFTSDWPLLGFYGEPSPGFDYSWLEVQNYFGLIGCEDYILNCKLFSSSRNMHIFMVRTQDGFEEVWDISEITFSYSSNDLSTLTAFFRDRCIHISNASASFIELLMKAHKLPLDTLSKICPFNPISFKIKDIPEHLGIPKESSKIHT